MVETILLVLWAVTAALLVRERVRSRAHERRHSLAAGDLERAIRYRAYREEQRGLTQPGLACEISANGSTFTQDEAVAVLVRITNLGTEPVIVHDRLFQGLQLDLHLAAPDGRLVDLYAEDPMIGKGYACLPERTDFVSLEPGRCLERTEEFSLDGISDRWSKWAEDRSALPSRVHNGGDEPYRPLPTGNYRLHATFQVWWAGDEFLIAAWTGRIESNVLSLGISQRGVEGSVQG